jgi:hypothetical protein
MSKQDDILIQRVGAALSQFPECRENDTALVFRVAGLYGASYAADVELFLSLPKTYRIKKIAKQLIGSRHGRT